MKSKAFSNFTKTPRGGSFTSDDQPHYRIGGEPSEFNLANIDAKCTGIEQVSGEEVTMEIFNRKDRVRD